MFLRSASSIRMPNWLVYTCRVVLLLMVCLMVGCARYYSVRYPRQVSQAFYFRAEATLISGVRLQWFGHKHDLDRYIREAARRHGVEEELIRAVILSESSWRIHAISRTGACGLMQIQPATFRQYSNGNPFDPYENIDVGTCYLAVLRRQFKNDLRLTLAAYNAGPTRVKRAGGVPPIPETQDYVKRTLRYYERNKRQRARR